MLILLLILVSFFIIGFITCIIKMLWAIITNDKDNKPYLP